VQPQRYACFDGYRDEPEQYGYLVSKDAKKSCEKQVAEQFQEMENRFAAWLGKAERPRDEDLFSAFQNARVVKNAEAYYRLSFKRNFSTWNLRDSHMAKRSNRLPGIWMRRAERNPKLSSGRITRIRATPE
jgi:erythromycin esterase-like protein